MIGEVGESRYLVLQKQPIPTVKAVQNRPYTIGRDPAVGACTNQNGVLSVGSNLNHGVPCGMRGHRKVCDVHPLGVQQIGQKSTVLADHSRVIYRRACAGKGNGLIESLTAGVFFIGQR